MRMIRGTRAFSSSAASLKTALEGTPAAVPLASVVDTSIKRSNVGGIDVITSDKASPLSAIYLGFKGGSRAETIDNIGASNVLSSLLYYSSHASSESIPKHVRNLTFNTLVIDAHASRESNTIQALVDRSNLEAAFKACSNGAAPRADHWEVKEAKERAVEQGVARNSSVVASVIDAAHWTAFRGQGLGRVPLPAGVNAGSRQVADFRDQFQTRGSAVAVGVGVDHAEFSALVEKYLAQALPEGAKPVAPKAAYFGGETFIEGQQSPAIVLAFESAAAYSKDYAATRVATSILGRFDGDPLARPGDGLTSRLAREARTAAHWAESFYFPYSDTGLFGVAFGSDSGKEGEATADVAAQLKALTEASSGEVEAAKNRVALQILEDQEDALGFAEGLARQALVGRSKVASAADLVAQVQSVSKKDVREAISSILKTRPTLVIEGDSCTGPSIDDIRKLF